MAFVLQINIMRWWSLENLYKRKKRNLTLIMKIGFYSINRLLGFCDASRRRKSTDFKNTKKNFGYSFDGIIVP